MRGMRRRSPAAGKCAPTGSGPDQRGPKGSTPPGSRHPESRPHLESQPNRRASAEPTGISRAGRDHPDPALATYPPRSGNMQCRLSATRRYTFLPTWRTPGNPMKGATRKVAGSSSSAARTPS